MTIETNAITQDQFIATIVNLCVRGAAKDMPRKMQDRHVLLKSVALTMEKGYKYSAQEVNLHLKAWLSDIGKSLTIDHVSLRRFLIDEGYLAKNPEGTSYWVSSPVFTLVFFAPEVEKLVINDIILEARVVQEQKKIEFLKKQTS